MSRSFYMRTWVKFTFANKIDWGNAWKVARRRKSWTSLNFSFNLSTFYLASILFTWLKFTCVNVPSQERVTGNQSFETFWSVSINASVNSSCAQPPPPFRATVEHLPAMSVPGVGHLQILHCPGAGHLPTPGPFPSFWHAHCFLSEYNYTEGFTGKKSRLAHLSKAGINWRGL